MSTKLFKKKTKRVTMGGSQFSFDLSVLIGEPKEFMMYKGSTTVAPECGQATWLVMNKFLPISVGQMQEFRAPPPPPPPPMRYGPKKGAKSSSSEDNQSYVKLPSNFY